MDKFKSLVKKTIYPISVHEVSNLCEMMHSSYFFRSVSGSALFTVSFDSSNRVIAKFNKLCFFFVLLWIAANVNFLYIVYSEDKSMIRSYYDTKLKHYGDLLERAASIVFWVIYSCKMTYSLKLNRMLAKRSLKLDGLMIKLGIAIDYKTMAKKLHFVCIAQTVVFFVRFIQAVSSTTTPREAALFSTILDNMVFIILTYHWFLMLYLRQSYQLMNEYMRTVRDSQMYRKCYLAQNRGLPNRDGIVTDPLELRDVENLKICAIIYSKLYRLVTKVNELFGTLLLSSLSYAFLTLLLQAFYMMECIAGGLLGSTLLLVYLLWRLGYSLVVAYLIIYGSQAVITEALRLSAQALTQEVRFTASNTVTLEYSLLLDGGRAVVSYMLMLLDFARQ